MRRGSVSTWETFGRRNSANMAQYSGGPVQFMTTDDIKYTRRDGWFVSYRRAVIFALLVVIVVIVAGFIGWYMNSTSNKQTRNVLTLIDVENDENEALKSDSVSPFLRPLKYRLFLVPVISDNGVTAFKGHVVIEFEIEGTARLNKIPLNAGNIVATQYELSSLKDEEKFQSRERRRCKRDDGGNGDDGDDNDVDDVGTTEGITIESTITEGTTISSIMTSTTTTMTLPMDSNETESTSTKSSEDDDNINETSTIPANKSEEVTISTKNSNDTSSKKTIEDEYLDNFANLFIREEANKNHSNVENIGIKEYNVDLKKGIHVIYPSKILPKGIYLLSIRYEIPDPSGVIFATNFSDASGNKWFIGTKSKGTAGSRTLFPLFDGAHLKAVFSLSLARRKEMKALSNGALENSTTNALGNWTIDTFEESILMSPRNLAFMMATNLQNISTVQNNSLRMPPVTFWTNLDVPKNANELYLVDKINEITSTLIDLLSTPMPLTKLDLVCSPGTIDDDDDDDDNVIRSPALISIRTSLFHSTNESPMLTKINALTTVIRSIGAQWLDGMASMKSWTDEWIFEGSLIYLPYLTIEKTRHLESTVRSLLYQKFDPERWRATATAYRNRLERKSIHFVSTFLIRKNATQKGC